MLSVELITTLRQLNPDEKLRVVQLLVNDLAAPLPIEPPLTPDEAKLLSMVSLNRTYEVGSPEDIGGGVKALKQLLEEEKAKAHA